MIRRPPRSTLPDTLCPYTLRCRSEPALNGGNPGPQEGLAFPQRPQGPGVDPQPSGRLQAAGDPELARRARLDGGEEPGAAGAFLDRPPGGQAAATRRGARRVGKARVSASCARGCSYTEKKQHERCGIDCEQCRTR